MTQKYDPVQKVSVVKQTTGRYGVLLYEVEESERGYLYGVDEMVNNMYVDDVNFEDPLEGNTVKQYESTYDGEPHERVVIESECITVEVISEAPRVR